MFIFIFMEINHFKCIQWWLFLQKWSEVLSHQAQALFRTSRSSHIITNKISRRGSLFLINMQNGLQRSWGCSWVKAVISCGAENLLRNDRSSRRDKYSRREPNQRYLQSGLSKTVFHWLIFNGYCPRITDGIRLLA